MCERDAEERDAMEPWFVESKALSVSCNYELIVWAAVWFNQSKQHSDEEEQQELGSRVLEETQEEGTKSFSLGDTEIMRETQPCDSPVNSPQASSPWFLTPTPHPGTNTCANSSPMDTETRGRPLWMWTQM